MNTMYAKRVRVRRGAKTYVYLKLVESYREGGGCASGWSPTWAARTG